MLLLLKILATVAPFVLAIYVSTLEIPRKTKIIVWIICLFISSLIVIYFVKEETQKKERIKTEEYYQNIIERQELFNRGLPKAYINGLGDHPLLRDFLKTGFNYIKDYKYKEAIKEFEKCLTYPKATESEKVAAHIEIGICYCGLSELREGEEHFRKALDISEGVKNKSEKLKGKSAALGNIGIVYSYLGKPNEALSYYNQALEIYKKSGDKEGMANSFLDLGVVYKDLGNPDEALRNYEEALEIEKEIGNDGLKADALGNIGTIYDDLGKYDEALKYHSEALEIFKKIKDEQGIANTLRNMADVQISLGKSDEALGYSNRALEIYKKSGDKEGMATSLLTQR